MRTSCTGFLLDENSGTFTVDDGRKVDFHNARFYDSENSRLFKANIPEKSKLPEPQAVCLLHFDVNAGERFCKLVFAGYEG